MSFGFSVGDFVLLVQLAFRTVDNARKACGEHNELTHETSRLHAVLQRVQQEASKPESPINRPGDSYREELASIASGCRRVLNSMDKILEKYNALSNQEKSVRKLWQKVRFGNWQIVDIRDLRLKITYYTSALSLFLNMVSAGSIGRVEKQMDEAGGDLREIRHAVHRITAHLMNTTGKEGSSLTTYQDDDKAVWKEFRRELIWDGVSSDIIQKHKKTIQEYVKELGSRGFLDEADPAPLDEDWEEETGAISEGINHHPDSVTASVKSGLDIDAFSKDSSTGLELGRSENEALSKEPQEFELAQSYHQSSRRSNITSKSKPSAKERADGSENGLFASLKKDSNLLPLSRPISPLLPEKPTMIDLRDHDSSNGYVGRPTNYPYRAQAIDSYKGNLGDPNKINFSKNEMLKVCGVNGRQWQVRMETCEEDIAPSIRLIQESSASPLSPPQLLFVFQDLLAARIIRGPTYTF